MLFGSYSAYGHPTLDIFSRLLSHPIHGKLASVMPNIRKLNTENKLQTSLFSVLSVRLREGYTIREIAITKGKELACFNL